MKKITLYLVPIALLVSALLVGGSDSSAQVQLMEGTVVQVAGSPTIYEIKSSERWAIPDEATFNARRYNWDAIQQIDEATAGQYPHTVTMISEGSVISATGDPDVWIIMYAGQRQLRRLVLSPTVFESYGHLRWEDIIEVSSAVLDVFAESRLVRAESGGNAWELEPSGDSGVRHEYAQTSAACPAERLGVDEDAVYVINSTDMAQYAVGESLLTDVAWVDPEKGDYTIPAAAAVAERLNQDPFSMAWHFIRTDENEAWSSGAYLGEDLPVFSWTVCVDAVPEGTSDWSFDTMWTYAKNGTAGYGYTEALASLQTRNGQRYVSFMLHEQDNPEHTQVPSTGFTVNAETVTDLTEAGPHLYNSIEGPFDWKMGQAYRFTVSRIGGDITLSITDEAGSVTTVGTHHVQDIYASYVWDASFRTFTRWTASGDPIYPVDATFSNIDPIREGKAPTLPTGIVSYQSDRLGVTEQTGVPSLIRFYQ